MISFIHVTKTIIVTCGIVPQPPVYVSVYVMYQYQYQFHIHVIMTIIVTCGIVHQPDRPGQGEGELARGVGLSRPNN